MGKHSVAIYNVQRLFRTGGSSIARSLDATSAHGWTEIAYSRKVAAIGAVLADAIGATPPAVLVLIEVEDAQVVMDIAAEAGWPSLVNVDLPGEAVDGYDVAIAYDPGTFGGGVLAGSSYTFNNRFSTRDLMVVTLKVGDGRTLTVAATHWPSRKISGTDGLRFAAAAYCHRILEEHLKFPKRDLVTVTGRPKLPSQRAMRQRWNAPLLVIGDFNEDPWHPVLRSLLWSTPDKWNVMAKPRLPTGNSYSSLRAYLSRRPKLFNPTWQIRHGSRIGGTYWYEEWHLLEQILVSVGTLNGLGPTIIDESLRIHAPRHVSTKNGELVEVTTRAGRPIAFDSKRVRGVSDHLPLVVDFHM